MNMAVEYISIRVKVAIGATCIYAINSPAMLSFCLCDVSALIVYIPTFSKLIGSGSEPTAAGAA